MHPNDGVLTRHAINQVGHHVLGDDLLDDLEERRFLFWLDLVGAPHQLVHADLLLVNLEDLDQGALGDLGIVKKLEQFVGVIVRAAGQGPGGAGDDALGAVG